MDQSLTANLNNVGSEKRDQTLIWDQGVGDCISRLPVIGGLEE